MITVSGLTKQYGTRTVVDDVSFTLEPGTVTGFLGPNGAGKTTTMRMITGLVPATAGSTRIDGRAYTDLPNPAAVVGTLLDASAVHPGRTGRAHLRILAAMIGVRDERVDEVLALVGLTEKARSRGRSLSGGQRRRLDVALGIIGRPTLLFLDEPTTGFDPEARRQFWSLIRSLRELGTTMLLTTHYLDEAEALADRVGVIARGRLAQVAVPALLGDRETAPAVVSWSEDGVRCSAQTTTPTAFVRDLAARFPGEVPDLTVARPTLEDVYLKMIGQGLK